MSATNILAKHTCCKAIVGGISPRNGFVYAADSINKANFLGTQAAPNTALSHRLHIGLGHTPAVRD